MFSVIKDFPSKYGKMCTFLIIFIRFCKQNFISKIFKLT